MDKLKIDKLKIDKLKLDKSAVCRVGIAFLIVMLFWEVYDFAVPILLERTYGLSATMRGLVMGMDNFLAVLLLPLFGGLSDRSRGKTFGRRTPFIVIGTILASLLVIVLALIENNQFQKLLEGGMSDVNTLVSGGFLDPKYAEGIYNGITDSSPLFNDYSRAVHQAMVEMALVNTMENPVSIICFISVLFMLLVAMASFRSPAVALMSDITPKPLRSSGNAIVNFTGGIGGFIAIGLYSFFAPDNGSYVTLFILLAALMCVFLMFYSLVVDENKLAKIRYENECKYNVVDEEEIIGEEKLSSAKKRSFILILLSIFLWFMGYNAVKSHLSVYATQTLGMSSTGVGLINFANGFGGALALLPVALLSTKIGRKKSSLFGYLIAVFAFVPCLFITAESSYLLGIFFVIAGIGLVMVNINTLPMVCELSRGSNVGKYTGYYYVAAMSAQAIAPFLAGLVMDNVHDNMMFTFAAVCISLALVVMLFVKHGDNKPNREEAKMGALDN